MLRKIVLWALLALVLICTPSNIADGTRTCPPATGGAGPVQTRDAPAAPMG